MLISGGDGGEACASERFTPLPRDDNAVAESREHARAGIFQYIEVFYNPPRLHRVIYRTSADVDRDAPSA